MRCSNANLRALLVSLSPGLLVFTASFFVPAPATPAAAPPPGGILNLGGNGGGQNNNGGNNNGYGAGANADFDSLIDLITSTVASESWAENGGGQAEIRPFPTGVIVDAAGTMKLIKAPASTELSDIRSRGLSVVGHDESTAGLRNDHSSVVGHDESTANIRDPALSMTIPAIAADPHQASKLRYVSLPRLEREIVRRQDAHKPLDATMLTLAGLQRVKYVFVYPESGDLVLAGPAGDWKVAKFGRVVSADTGQPIERLDDLLVLLRRAQQSPESYFGCMINPRQEALAQVQDYLNKTSSRPLEPSQRDAWISKLRDMLGKQDIEVFGVDPATRVAHVMVEADYHMKLIGMGLADGADGVDSYLDMVVASHKPAASMAVLRWWFALNYSAIGKSEDGNSFEFSGQGARVESENEMLAAQGKRVHTGQSDPLNQKFADDFTAHFADIAKTYRVYGELRSIFDLAMAVALIQTDHLAERVAWKPSRLLDADKLRLPQAPIAKEVDTVANYRVANARTIIAGVSGGVMVAPADALAKPRETASAEALAAHQNAAPPADQESGVWWWDQPRPPSDSEDKGRGR
jgi:Protein of unknown function (DUF1598)